MHLRHPFLIVALMSLFCGGCGTKPASTLDLTFASAPLYSPPAPTSGQIVTISFVVAVNDSSSTPVSVPWRVFRDGVDGFLSGTTAAITPGTTAPQTVQVQEPSGTHSYDIVLDPDGAIAESDENDNVAGVTITWGGTPPPAGVDLYFAVPPAVSPANPAAGATFTLSFTVGNATGDGSGVGGFDWSISRDGIPGYQTGTIPGLGPNATQSVSLNLIESTGSHTFTVILDPNNTVSESNEGDNTQSVTVPVSFASHHG